MTIDCFERKWVGMESPANVADEISWHPEVQGPKKVARPKTLLARARRWIVQRYYDLLDLLERISG